MALFLLLLVFSTVSDYLIGHAMHRTDTTWKRKMWLFASVFVNLGLLFYFKYAYFLADFFSDAFGLLWEPKPYMAIWSNATFGSDFVETAIILPVGISFYTFQCLSYTIDLYRKKIKPVNRVLDFGFFVSFFPQLVAGPIVRASEFFAPAVQGNKAHQGCFWSWPVLDTQWLDKENGLG